MEDISISTNKLQLDPYVIHNFLSKAYWSENIPKWIGKKAIENSLCFGVYDADKQIGFARVVTDYTTFAFLADVFILEEYRGKGLSKKLMAEVMNHPELKTIRRWMLVTKDAHGLYKQFGWTPLDQPERWMNKFNG